MKLLQALIACSAAVGVCTSAAVEQYDERSQADDFFRLNFNIHRGNNRADNGPGRTAKLVRRDAFSEDNSDAKVIYKRDSVEMVIENADTFYLAKLIIGSNQDEVEVLVDTGSADLWVMSHDVDCEAASSSSSKRKRDGESLGITVGSIIVHPRNGTNSTKTTEDVVQGKGFGSNIMSMFDSYESDDPLGVGGGNPIATATDDSNTGSGTNTCTSYGSFNTGKSDSFSRNKSASAFSIEYADGTSALGVWGYDDVELNNITIKDLSLAIANETSSNIGVLGIGLPGLEVTYSLGSSSSAYQYENLPLKLKNQGYIEKNAYSLYLGKSTTSSGTILFGAVDHAKYEGTLKTVPIVNSLEAYNYDEPIRLEINMDAVVLKDGSDQVQVNSNGYTALLDTGSTLSYMPSTLLENFASTLDLDYSNSIGAYLIDCDVSSDTKIVFDFSGVNITAPVSDFVLEVSLSTCVLGIFLQSSDYLLLGDNFLRNAYVVYDLDDYTISLAPVKHTSDEDIEAISNSIPGAETVSGAATAAYSGGDEGSASDTIELGSSGSSGSKSSDGSTVPVVSFVGLLTTILVIAFI